LLAGSSETVGDMEMELMSTCSTQVSPMLRHYGMRSKEIIVTMTMNTKCINCSRKKRSKCIIYTTWTL